VFHTNVLFKIEFQQSSEHVYSETGKEIAVLVVFNPIDVGPRVSEGRGTFLNGVSELMCIKPSKTCQVQFL
jgi:hypothetical protein